MNTNKRIDSIDILRGLALALMLLVNNPGSWAAVYAPFLHAQWHGLTPTDLVFPFFLFVVGASMACSFGDNVNKIGISWISVLKRTFLLFIIGFLLNIFPFDQPLENARVMGVLQRIALSFLIVAMLISFLNLKKLFIAFTVLLGLYWLLLAYGSDSPYSLETNIVRQVDLLVLGSSHMWAIKGVSFEPEGLLSTIGSSLSVLSGYLICKFILQKQDHRMQIKRLLIIGLIFFTIAFIWSYWHPINKSLWTSSFVLMTNAWACFVLALIVYLISQLKFSLGLQAFTIYGSNPIFIYVVSWIAAVLLTRVEITYETNDLSVKGYIYQSLTQFMPDKLASLSFAVLFMMSFFLLAFWLYKKQIFIKL